MTSPGLQHSSAPETTSSAPSTAQRGGLETALKPRHITMISIAGVIGAGLFVGSAKAIATAGPAVLVSYALAGALVVLVMRMLGEMAIAQPDTGSFSTYADRALGRWAGFSIGWLYWWFWVIVIPVEATAGALILGDWFPAVPQWAFALDHHRTARRVQPAERGQLRGVRVLVRPGQGRRDRALHRPRHPCHPRRAAGLAHVRRRTPVAGRRVHAQRCRLGPLGHADHDVHLHGHRDRDHRGRRVAAPRVRHPQGRELRDLADQPLLPGLHLHRRRPGSLERHGLAGRRLRLLPVHPRPHGSRLADHGAGVRDPHCGRRRA